MRLTQALTRAVQHRSAEAATVYRGRTRSWAEFSVRARSAAARLQQLGVADGERVAVVASNSDDYAELLFAIVWAGGVGVPINIRWSTVEMARALSDCRPHVLFVDEGFVGYAERIVADCAAPPVVLSLGGARIEGAASYDELATAGLDCPESTRSGDDLALICYTGGTTSRARGVMLSHTNLISCSLMWIGTLDFDELTRYLHSPGFFHMAGAAPLFALTLAGGTHIILPKFDPAEAMVTIEAEHVNYCLLVPTMINAMLNHEDFPRRDLTSVRTVEYGASPMPEALLRQLIRQLPGWRLIQGYGCTEATALVTALPSRYHVLDGPLSTKLQTAGRAVAGTEVRVVDHEGVEVPHGTVGEIVVRGPAVMLGYWEKHVETEAAVRDGWLHTGDGARMDDEGFITIVDRLKDMIVSGGENIYSGEVEQAIYDHPGVAECAVIGIPDEHWGEAVHAVVVPRPDVTLTEQEIVAHCRTRIAGYKCPRSVNISTDTLPLSGAGKIMKKALRAPYWEGRTRSVH